MLNILVGAASLIGPHLTALGLSEIQLDNLLHITVERGAIESLVTKNVGIWLSHTDKAVNMYQRTASDFPEYVKECLSNETYSKITSIKHLASSLHDSLSSHVVAIEQARLHVFNSPTVPFPPQLTRRLQKSLKAEVIDKGYHGTRWATHRRQLGEDYGTILAGCWRVYKKWRGSRLGVADP